MRYQLHYQSLKDLSQTEFLGQFSATSTGEYRRKIDELMKANEPLPEDVCFMICLESSKYFEKDKGDYDDVKKD